MGAQAEIMDGVTRVTSMVEHPYGGMFERLVNEYLQLLGWCCNNIYIYIYIYT